MSSSRKAAPLSAPPIVASRKALDAFAAGAEGDSRAAAPERKQEEQIVRFGIRIPKTLFADLQFIAQWTPDTMTSFSCAALRAAADKKLAEMAKKGLGGPR